MRYAKALLVSAAALLLVGCSTGPRYCPYCGADLKAPPKTQGPAAIATPVTTPAAVYKIAPSKLFELAQQALKEKGLTIVSAQAGVIQTDWKQYEGEYHIARRWLEQTRYRVSVIPDISDPANASRFEVSEETQRRSNERASWERADPRPQRAREITDAIAAKLR